MLYDTSDTLLKAHNVTNGVVGVGHTNIAPSTLYNVTGASGIIWLGGSYREGVSGAGVGLLTLK